MVHACVLPDKDSLEMQRLQILADVLLIRALFGLKVAQFALILSRFQQPQQPKEISHFAMKHGNANRFPPFGKPSNVKKVVVCAKTALDLLDSETPPTNAAANLQE